MADDIVNELLTFRDILSEPPGLCMVCEHPTAHDDDCLIRQAADKIERLRAERNDFRNTLSAIYSLAVQVMEQHPSHAAAWIDVQHMTLEAWQERRQAHKEARRG